MSKSFSVFLVKYIIQPLIEDTNNSYNTLVWVLESKIHGGPESFKNICIPSLRWNESIVVQLVMT